MFDSESGALVTAFPGELPRGELEHILTGTRELTDPGVSAHNTAHAAPIRSISFTSNLLITGSDDKRINVFDLRALTATSAGAGVTGGRRGQVASLGGHEGWVVKVEARNDRLLASG